MPASIEPMAWSHLRIRAGLIVTVSTSSRAVKRTSAGRLSFTNAATFSSPSRFLLPDGDQSDPSAITTPARRAAVRLAVFP